MRGVAKWSACVQYYRDDNIIAIDINNLSAFIHELTHMIDYQNGLSGKDREKLIARFKPKITLYEWQNNKKNYYFKDYGDTRIIVLDNTEYPNGEYDFLMVFLVYPQEDILTYVHLLQLLLYFFEFLDFGI